MAVLELINITKNFGGIKALKRIDMIVEKGEIHGLIGPNGAGKTTLFNIIAGNYLSSSGQVILEGVDINNLSNEERVDLGIVRTFQNIRLFPSFSVLDHVKAGFHRRIHTNWISTILNTKSFREKEEWIDKESHRLLEQMNLNEFADSLAKNLSYGDQRRLEIARALATSPKMLLLDEPAAGLNESEVEILLEQIKSISRMGITIILVEHDMSLVMNICDRITVLSSGEKIAEGTAEEILGNERVIREYLGTGSVN